MTAIRLAALPLAAAAAMTVAVLAAEPATKTAAPTAAKEAELVERVIASRKEYQQSVATLYQHYAGSGEREKAKWAEDELKAYHLGWKPSYRLDILDVPPEGLTAKVNVKEANELFKLAMEYKGRGIGNDYILNQRRTELLLQEILQKYPNCDKIADVAYELGDLYSDRAYKQYDRSAAYFERSYQWRKGSRTDALMRAARLHDRELNERSKALELYRLVIETDTDPARIKEATRRRDELTGANRK